MVKQTISEKWLMKKLSEVCPLQRGFDLPSSALIDGSTPVVYSNGIHKYHSEYKVCAPGVVTGRSGTIGKVHYIDKNYWPHNTTLWVTDFCGNYPKYIYYLLVYLKLDQFCAGSGVPTLNRNDVHSQIIGVPPLPEQQKIAEILSTWDEAIEKLGRLIELKKLRFEHIRNRILKLQELELIELGKLFEIKIGGTPSRKVKEYWDEAKQTNNRWMSIADMDEKYLADSKEYLSDLGVSKSNVKLISKDTLVLSFKLSLGRVGILKEKFYTNEAIAALIPREENIDNEFFYYILQTVNYDQYVDVAAKGKTLNKQKLQEDVLVPYCSYDFQKKIGKVLHTIDSEIQYLISYKNYIQQQKRGLMQKLLTGKVRVKR